MGLMAQFVDRVAVMYAGRLTEISAVRDMFVDPLHPYAQALIESLPTLDNKGVFRGIPGLAPSLLRLPTGCAFHPRCPHAMDICKNVVPALDRKASGRFVACHLYDSQGNLIAISSLRQ
jgi:peptide/nickel transport system ATP-binding protein